MVVSGLWIDVLFHVPHLFVVDYVFCEQLFDRVIGTDAIEWFI